MKGKGGLVRTVPITDDRIIPRMRFHLEGLVRGKKRFVPDEMQTHVAIKHVQAFLYLNRARAQDPDSHRPMTFHGLRHTRAAEWYREDIRKGHVPHQARKEVSKPLGHGRDDVTRIYLASLKGGDRDTALIADDQRWPGSLNAAYRTSGTS